MKKFKSESIHEALVEETYADNIIQYVTMLLVAAIGIFGTLGALSDIGRNDNEAFLRWRSRNERRAPRREEKEAIPFTEHQLAY